MSLPKTDKGKRKSYIVQFMAGEVKHRELTDLAPHLSDPAHFLKNFSLGVKETPAFSSTIFMAGDHHMEKNYSKVSRWQQRETNLL